MEQWKAIGRWANQWPWIAALAGFALFYAAYFAPALLRGAVLAPGDALLYHMPFFFSPVQVWSPLMLSGYAAIGDPQAQTLYPLRLLSPTFNVFVISAYVAAAVGTFGLALRLTQSRLAALCAAFVMSGSGFMLAHLGQTSIIHSAAWLPWILWACVEVAESTGFRSVALGAMAVALSLLGGHPQVSSIALLLCGAFAVYAVVGRWRLRGARSASILALRFVALFGLGAMLAAPMLVPAMHAAAESVRPEWTRQHFDSYSHTLQTLRMLAFPNLYGAVDEGPYGAYAGPWNATELAIYVGFLPLFLALAALADRANRGAVWFWAAACGAGVLLTLGTGTPLGELLYHMPVVGQFGAQARFGLVTTAALAILAAYGVAAILRAPVSTRWRLLVLLAVGLSTAFVLLVALSPPTPPGLPARSWRHPALRTALALMLLCILAFAALLRRPGRATAALVIALATVDVASFGWFYHWRYAPPADVRAPLSPEGRHLVAQMASGEGRVFPVDAFSMPVNPLRPNMNLAYGVPSVAGQTPLLPQRYATFSGADSAGNLPALAPSAPLMDVLAVRWFAGGTNAGQAQLLGAGCGVVSEVGRLRARLPADANGTLRIVSHMACSQGLVTGTPVATVRLVRSDGTTQEAGAIRAGVETAEWSYDRPDVRAVVAHARPPVAETFAAPDVQGLWFVGEIPVSTPGDSGAVVEVVLDRGVMLPLRIKSVEYVPAGSSARQMLAMTPAYPGEEQELTTAVRFEPLTHVSERKRYKGMVWSVCSVRTAPRDEIVARLRTAAERGKPPAFDATREALLEPGVELPALSCREPPEAELRSRSVRRWALSTFSKGDGLLIVSERFAAGWRARLDGVDVPVLPVDGLVLGVRIPDGEHVVELRYLPPGFALSLALFAVAALACAWPFIRKFFPLHLRQGGPRENRA